MYRGIYKLLVPMLFILLTSSAHAAYDDLDNPPDLFCQPGKTAGNNPAFGGKPISLLSGMETFAPSTDLTLGSYFPIRVTRSYNSRTSYDSPLGYGWAINYDKRLYTYADNSVTVRRECGGKKRFTWYSPTGTYVGQTGDAGTLVLNAEGHLYTDKYGETEQYDTRGRLVRMADAKGNSLKFTYRADTRDFLYGLLPFNIDQNNPLIVAYDYHLSKIEEKDASGNLTGKYVDLNYDGGTGRLTSITDGSRTVSYGHDSIGNLTTANGPNINSIYGYTASGNKHLLTSIDEGQGAYVNEYDATGRVTNQKHGTGEIVFDYTIPYQKTTMTTYIRDSSGTLNTQTRTVEFDTNGMVVKVTDTFGNSTTYVRDNATTWLLEEGHRDVATGITTTTAYDYDGKGNVLARIEALDTAIEKTTSYTYDPVYNLVTTETVTSVVSPSLVSTITRSYDSQTSNLLSIQETGLLGAGAAYSYTTTYEYDANGRMTRIDGPRTDVSDVTTYAYDPTTGFLLSTTQPLIGATTYSNHDALGNPRTVTDPNGNAAIYTYDTTGRVQTVQAAGDTMATQYFYVAGGCTSCGGANKIDHITLPEGNSIWYTYDTMGNLSSIKDNANNSINYTYDSEGNKLTEQIKDSGGVLQKTLSYSYDALNRPKRITNPDSTYTEYGYDARGNRVSLQTPNSQLSTYGYDALNRLTSTLQPLSASTIYGYDTNNNLTSVTDAATHTTAYKMDDRSRVYQVISPDTGTTTYSYDPAGNMISKTDAKGVTVSYVYDALNRLTKIDFPTDTDTVYVYDNCVNGKGRVCSKTDASGTAVYEYTAKGQIKKETKTIDGVQYITQYSYDMNGNLKTLTDPSGEVTTYNFTNDKAVSVLNNAANLATSINYKPFGGVSSLSFGNGIAGSIGYDNQYRVSGITAGSAMNLSYPTYDANGNAMAINNALDPTKNKSFTYDSLDRLSTATASGLWGSLSWTYDGVGNRQMENSTAYSYTPSTNKLNTVGGTSYGFDNNGNTTSQGARQYTYNQNQRLVQVVDSSMTATYTYNSDGQRVKKNVNGTVTIFHYDQGGQLIAESIGAGAITARYVYLNGQPLAKIEGTNIYYYHNDALGTPQKMTDASGTVVWSADYKPFGETTVTISTITNNLRFPGQYYDQETGLHYNYFRDYNPTIGRFVEADPIGIVEGANHSYVYAYSNPIGYYDPDGQFAWAVLIPCIKGGLTSAIVDITVQQCKCCWKQYGSEMLNCKLGDCPPINKCSVAVSAVVGCAAGYIPGAPPTTMAGLKIILQKVGASAILKFLAKLGC